MRVKAEYLGGEVIEGTGATVNAPGIPAGTTTIEIIAEDGDVYATINGDAGQLISPIYVGDTEHVKVGPFDNIRSLGIFAAGSVWAHIQYSAERLGE